VNKAKIKQAVALSLIGFSFSGLALAQVTDLRAPNSERPEVKVRIQAERQNFVDNLRDKREAAKNELDAKRGAVRSAVIDRKEAARTEFESRRAEFETKLNTIRDERKRNLVQKINNQLADFNERVTGHFGEVIDKLSAALQRIIARVNQAEERDFDVTSVRTAIANAEAAIANAKNSVVEQAGKSYIIEITDEATLRAAAKAAKDALQADLRKVREIVKIAHDAVRRAATAFASIRGANNEVEVNSEN